MLELMQLESGKSIIRYFAPKATAGFAILVVSVRANMQVVEELLEARGRIGYLEEGQVAITPGFHLPAKYIIHAVSPFYYDGESGEEEKLRACYRGSLRLAEQHGCKSIAFPLIATGVFGYLRSSVHHNPLHKD